MHLTLDMPSITVGTNNKAVDLPLVGSSNWWSAIGWPYGERDCK